MIFIIGGAGSGQKDYAAAAFPDRERITDYHLTVKHQMEEGLDPLAAAKRLLAEHPDAVITTDEIGCGLVPVDASERTWREQAGRANCLLAERAEQVILMNCGLARRIK